jgi:hypothetical protein
MPLSSQATKPDRSPDDGSELTPLVTDEAREFLEGTITAEAYSEFVSLHAAREAGYDAALHSIQQATKIAVETRVVAVLAILAVATYAVVGAILSSNEETGLTLIVAAGSGVAAGTLVTILYQRHRRE